MVVDLMFTFSLDSVLAIRNNSEIVKYSEMPIPIHNNV